MLEGLGEGNVCTSKNCSVPWLGQEIVALSHLGGDGAILVLVEDGEGLLERL